MIKNYHSHKRNTSECFHKDNKPCSIPNKPLKGKSKSKNKSQTLFLIEKSARKVSDKQTVVEELDEPTQYYSNPFFAFGKRESAPKNWNIGLDKIIEVQDSKREMTSHRSHREGYYNPISYQNRDISNFEDKIKKSRKSKTKLSKSSTGKQKKSDKSRSTISLSRVKNGSKDLELRTQKIEKSMKMLWECMGELWQCSRVSQYRSQKNSESSNLFKRKLQEHQKQILDIKFDLCRGKDSFALRC